MQTGDVVQLGQHRLMCGDAGNPDHVAMLFDGAKPDLVFTSPPYMQQREYGQAIDCWDTLMQRVFGAMPWHQTTQVLVNLGLIHRKGEWLPYWDGWIKWMRTQGWKRHGMYVWDKGEAMPGDRGGRLAPTFEFVFHFNKASVTINKTEACKWHGKRTGNSGGGQAWSGNIMTVASHKIMGAVLHVSPEKRARFAHPATFPIALPAKLIGAFTQERHIFYDPFCGSGTSILAAEQTGRVCYAMEIEQAYCQIAIDRWRQRKPMQPTLAMCQR